MMAAGPTLFRYLFGRQLRMIVLVLTAIVVIAYLVDFTEFARRAGSWPEYTLMRGMYLSAMRMPMIMMLIWPFVILFAAMAVLIALNRRYELVVARSAGISAWQFLAPICLASFVVGVVAVTVVNPFAAHALTMVEDLEATLRYQTHQPQATDSLNIPWLRQRDPQGFTIIGAATTARRGIVLGDAVFLQFDNNGDFIARYDARSAVLDDGAWMLNEAVETTASRERRVLESYSLATTLRPAELEQRLADASTMSVYELLSKARIAESLGLSGDRFMMQFHSLVALPMLLVAMTLIAATVSLRFARMGQSGSLILGGIGAGFLLYVALVVTTAFGNVGFVPPLVAAWVPVVAAMFGGVSFLLYKEDG